MPQTRSAVSNGSRILEGVDGRSPGARRFKDLVAAFVSDLGGDSHLNAAQRVTLRNAAAISLRLEQLQAAIARGESVDADELIRLASTSHRLLRGLPKQERSNPALVDYLASKAKSL